MLHLPWGINKTTILGGLNFDSKEVRTNSFGIFGFFVLVNLCIWKAGSRNDSIDKRAKDAS